MKTLRKSKIGVRLYGMFGLMITALIIVSFLGIASRLNQVNDTEFLKQNYIDHLEMLADVNVTTGNLFLSYRNYFLEYPDAEKMQVRLNDINNRTNFIMSNLQEYQSQLEARSAPPQDLDNVKNAILKIQKEVVPFNTMIIDLMQTEQLDEVHKLIISKELRSLRSSLQDDLITQIYNDCVKNITVIMDKNVSDMKTANMTTAILVVIGIVIVAVLMRLVVRSLIIPVKQIEAASKEIAAGKIDVNLPEIANDEIGELTKQFGNVASVLKSLVAEMEDVANHHQNGDIEALIDQSHYDGAFAVVAVGINEMVESYVNHMRDIRYVLKEFGGGNFEVEYALLPGRKAELNEAVEGMRKNLKDINGEIELLSKAAVNGELDKRTDPNAFKGDWNKLLVGLNAVMDAIITPINEASGVLDAMARGDLKAVVSGEYKGGFAQIKNSLNTTQAAISSYITEISSVLGEMSKENLAVSIDRDYIGDFSLIKDSINMIVRVFNNVLAEFNASAEHMAIGSRQISESSYDLAQGATEQASTVEQLNAAIEQVSTQTNNNADTANKANALVIKVKNGAVKEAGMMRDTLTAMDAINESSTNISKIIKVIEDIAFQTNLLALNAAVEAARAGEHGKGFAVVAEEVRNLASRSQAAAKDTTELIESSVQKASEGALVASETAEGLNIIVDQISEISSFIGGIAKASNEQRVNIGQINSGIAQVAQVAQTNTSISEESAASAEELSSQADILKDTIGRFKLG